MKVSTRRGYANPESHRQNALVEIWLRLHGTIIQLSDIDAAIEKYSAESVGVAQELEEERASLFIAIQTRNIPWINTSLRYMYRLILASNQLEFAQPLAVVGDKFSGNKRGMNLLYEGVEEILRVKGTETSTKKILLELIKLGIAQTDCVARSAKQQGPVLWLDDNGVRHEVRFDSFAKRVSLQKNKLRVAINK